MPDQTAMAKLSPWLAGALFAMLVHADSAASTSATSVAATWWRSRFQALWMPSLRYADESMGFVQLDISLNDSV